MEFLAILIPALPLAAAIATAVLGPRRLRENSHRPCVGATVLAFILSVFFLFGVLATADGEAVVADLYTWAAVPGLTIDVSLRADALTAVMLVVVTLVSALVAIYSAAYMHGDRGYSRFFALISLFVFSMCMLVLANNFLLLYVFWEAVGLCSYLLIGFWYERPAAAAAGKKAFLVNRIGDFCFALGVFLIWTTFGTFQYETVLAEGHVVEAGTAVPLICLLLFAGAVGKSAQFPLHVWLPDAMEGPTSVSALIHAATMVTAGVYLVARCTPLFEHAPGVQLLVASIGCFTALLAALIALTQTDLKRVLAYSTVSQLGFMFLGLGTGSLLGIVGGMFHLVTHAFFKALLFLGAGSVMHAMGGVIDMRRIGGLRHRMPTTAWTFGVGALALAGFPLLSGFWSKDEILSAVRAAGHERNAYTVFYWLASATATLTAFYTFRAFLLTFWGEERIPEEAGDHAHESPSLMTFPLKVLAGGAALVGLALGPTGLFAGFLERTPGLGHEAAHHGFDWAVMGTSSILAIAGIGGAWLVYGGATGLADGIARALGPLYRLSLGKFYFDEVYYAVIVLPLRGLAQACRFADWLLIDGSVTLISRLPGLAGRLVLRPIQNGLVQFYALAMLMGLSVLIAGLFGLAIQYALVLFVAVGLGAWQVNRLDRRRVPAVPRTEKRMGSGA